MSIKCNRCRDRGHVQEGGRWVRCSCLARTRLLTALRTAGIPPEVVARALAGETGDVAQPGQAILLTTGPTIDRALLGAATAVLRGRSVVVLRLHRLLRAEFGEDDFAKNTSRNSGLLVIICSGDPAHKWTLAILRGYVMDRAAAGLSTVVAVDGSPAWLPDLQEIFRTLNRALEHSND